MTMAIYKMHINIKDRVCNFSNSLMKSEKLQAENILIDNKNYKDLVV